VRNGLGAALFLPLLTALLLYPHGREILDEEAPPAFFVEPAVAGVWVAFGDGFPRPGIHQFSDGTTLRGVMEMTELPVADYHGAVGILDERLLPGEELQLLLTPLQTYEINRGWMPAGQRVALGICLHPDRMSLADWEYLPGIGEKLARAIELDRQKNGNFGALPSLQRVRGIGPGRIAAWGEFFCPAQAVEYK
jgi:competence protein ComEA